MLAIPVQRLEQPNDGESAFVQDPVTHGIGTVTHPARRRGAAYPRRVDSGEPYDRAPGGDAERSTDLVTWTLLLGRWTALVKAGEGLALAAPDDVDAARWRRSIPEVITLQSIAFALGELESLPSLDRSLARDRADLAVTESCERLDGTWRGVAMPGGLLEIASDARRAVEVAVYAGLRWGRVAGDRAWRMPQVAIPDDEVPGTLALMQPGTLALAGSPVAWWTECEPPEQLAAAIEQGELEVVAGPPVQVYRMLDEEGRAVRDEIVGLDDLPAGVPLLVPISLDGRSIGRFTVDPERWAAANDAAVDLADPPPVVFGEGIEAGEFDPSDRSRPDRSRPE